MGASRIKLTASGIYQIRNVVNGKKYIGSAKRLCNRFYMHRCELKGGYHGNPHLQAAYNKYGRESFVYEVIEECSVADLLTREQARIDEIPESARYNILPLAGSPAGRKMPVSFCLARQQYRHTDEAKQKISASARGRKMPPRTDEQRKRLSEACKGRTAWNKKIHPIMACQCCGRRFTVKPYKLNVNRGKFCSRQCKAKFQQGKQVAPQTQFKPGMTPWNKKPVA